MYGGSYAEYLDTPAAIVEILLRIEDAHAAPPPAPLGEEFTPSIT